MIRTFYLGMSVTSLIISALDRAANYCLVLALDDSKEGMLNHKAGSFMDDGNRLFL